MKKKNIIIVVIILIILLGLIFLLTQDKTYKVEFSGVEGIENLEIESGNHITKPADPIKEGYEFIGWYYNDKLFDFNQKVTEDIKLEARWKEKTEQNPAVETHKITFDTDGGSIVAESQVENGKSVSKPTDPTKEGYKFLGWYKGDNEYDFHTVVTEDITLVAKWAKEKEEENKITYKITFNTDGGSSISTKTVEEGKTVLKPSNPTKKGYRFVKWQLDGKDYNFSTKVTKNFTLKAVWEKVITYTVKFDTDGGSSVAAKTVEENKTISKPTNPTKSGYIFVKWQLDGKDYNFTTKITKDITLKAVWRTPNKYTVTFDSNGGSSVASKTVEENKTVSKPTNPTKSGYIFVKWQLNGKDYNFSSKITKNITLKAVWKQKSYTYSVAYVDPMTPADVKITVYEEGKAISIAAIYRPTDGKRICGAAAVTQKSNIENFTKLTIELTSGIKVAATKK